MNHLVKVNIRLPTQAQVSNMETRRNTDLRTQRSRTVLHKRSLLSSSIRIYNTLPHEIRQIQTFALFCKKVKQFINQNQNLIKTTVNNHNSTNFRRIT